MNFTHVLSFQDQKILQLTDEVTRLRAIEMESFRKDQQVQQLQQQLGSLESQVSQQPPVVMGVDQEMTAKLVQLETEVAAKKEELEKLKEEVMVLFNFNSESDQL